MLEWGRALGGSSGKMLRTDHNPDSPSSCTTWGKEVEESGVKLRLGRGDAKKAFLMLFIILIILL